MDGTDSLKCVSHKKAPKITVVYEQSACLNAAIKFHVGWLFKDEFSFDRSH